MNTTSLRQQLHEYLEIADDRKIKAIYTMVEEDIEQQHTFTFSKKEMELLEEERNKHIKRESKSFSWDTAKAMIRKNMI